MIWTVALFVGIALGLIYALFAFLRAVLARSNKDRISAYDLGLIAFPLILVGIVALDVRGNMLSRDLIFSTRVSVEFLLENFGWLLVQSGLIFLFILFCVSLMRTSAKANGKSENTIGEYLR